MTIKVLQLGSPTGLYGAERWILALVRYLDSTEIESIVASIKDDPTLEVPLCREAERLGFKTRVFKAYGRFNFSAVRQLRAYIREHGIDILHTHSYKQDLIGLMATFGTECKIISTPHGWSRDAGLKLQCYEALNRAVFPLFDRVVPLSPELYRPLKRIPFLKHKLRLIQNGVDTGEILACRTIAPELVEWQAQGALIIGYIGQLVHR
ncbi:MAG: glycosyltransferase family 4 protein, partial [Desulfobacterium sp.]|nr:glycosyltransferase family 4 protein [Desulfobacterium sp.]